MPFNLKESLKKFAEKYLELKYQISEAEKHQRSVLVERCSEYLRPLDELMLKFFKPLKDKYEERKKQIERGGTIPSDANEVGPDEDECYTLMKQLKEEIDTMLDEHVEDLVEASDFLENSLKAQNKTGASLIEFLWAAQKDFARRIKGYEEDLKDKQDRGELSEWIKSKTKSDEDITIQQEGDRYTIVFKNIKSFSIFRSFLASKTPPIEAPDVKIENTSSGESCQVCLNQQNYDKLLSSFKEESITPPSDTVKKKPIASSGTAAR